MKKILIYITTLAISFTLLSGMEIRKLPKKDCPLFVSYVEAMMAGNFFCFDKKGNCRFKHYKKDEFYVVPFVRFCTLHWYYKQLSESPIEQLPCFYFIEKYGMILSNFVLKSKARKNALIQQVRLQRNFNNDKEYEANRLNFSKALDEAADHNISFEDLNKVCYVRTCPNTFLLRDCLKNKLPNLPQKEPIVGRLISLIDAAFQKKVDYDAKTGNFEFSHFKKSEKKYFYTSEEIKKTLGRDILLDIFVSSEYQKLMYLLKIKYDTDGYRMLLMSVNPKQRKRLIMLRTIVDYAFDELALETDAYNSWDQMILKGITLRHEARCIDREKLLRRLKLFDGTIKNQLDGFENVSGDQFRTYSMGHLKGNNF